MLIALLALANCAFAEGQGELNVDPGFSYRLEYLVTIQDGFSVQAQDHSITLESESITVDAAAGVFIYDFQLEVRI